MPSVTGRPVSESRQSRLDKRPVSDGTLSATWLHHPQLPAGRRPPGPMDIADAVAHSSHWPNVGPLFPPPQQTPCPCSVCGGAKGNGPQMNMYCTCSSSREWDPASNRGGPLARSTVGARTHPRWRAQRPPLGAPPPTARPAASQRARSACRPDDHRGQSDSSPADGTSGERAADVVLGRPVGRSERQRRSPHTLCVLGSAG